jgi:subtilisin family serine protease
MTFVMAKAPLIALALLAVASPASAQVPDLSGTVGAIVQPPIETIEGATRHLTDNALPELRNAREMAMRQLRRAHRDVIDRDRDGALVIRSEVVAIAPTAEALAAARAQGFIERETVEADGLGLSVVVLAAPPGMSTRRAVDALRRLDPDGAYDFNHIYFGAGDERGGAKQASSRDGPAGGVRIGLIDSGVSERHGAFAHARLEQRGFGGAPIASEHGTSIASILAGDTGAAPGASLYVADVYGGRPTGGGASAIVAALSWLVQSRASVINISLVGPPNRALEAAVAAAQARGHVIVAAVGNDGPSAPPLYPAAYAGVIGVTGVDARDRALPEAGRGAHVDFAAPGSDFSAASSSGGYARVRGTSYAAPIVAGLLAQRMQRADAGAAERARSELSRTAIDLGDRGVDRTYGAGLVGRELRAPDRLARR